MDSDGHVQSAARVGSEVFLQVPCHLVKTLGFVRVHRRQTRFV